MQLFARGQHHADLGQLLPCFHQAAHGLEGARDARFVVGGQNGVAGRADDAVFDHRLDARARLHRVHVAAQHQRTRHVACAARDEVARVGARLGCGIVEAHREAEGFQLGAAPRGHGAFVPRRAFDAHKLAKQVQQAVGFHGGSVSYSESRARRLSVIGFRYLLYGAIGRGQAQGRGRPAKMRKAHSTWAMQLKPAGT